MRILVVGFPRSGTNLLHRMLENYVGEDGHKVSKIHWRYQLANFAGQNPKVVHIVRDPRDTALSGYYYYMQHFGEKRGHTFENFRLYDFLEGPFSNGFDGRDGWPKGWVEHIRYWMDRPDIERTSYRALMESGPYEIMRLVQATTRGEVDWRLAVKASVDAKIVGNTRPPYIPQADWHLKPKVDRPKMGEWRNHFGLAEKAFMEEYCGELMSLMGYGKE